MQQTNIVTYFIFFILVVGQKRRFIEQLTDWEVKVNMFFRK